MRVRLEITKDEKLEGFRNTSSVGNDHWCQLVTLSDFCLCISSQMSLPVYLFSCIVCFIFKDIVLSNNMLYCRFMCENCGHDGSLQIHSYSFFCSMIVWYAIFIMSICQIIGIKRC